MRNHGVSGSGEYKSLKRKEVFKKCIIFIKKEEGRKKRDG